MSQKRSSGCFQSTKPPHPKRATPSRVVSASSSMVNTSLQPNNLSSLISTGTSHPSSMSHHTTSHTLQKSTNSHKDLQIRPLPSTHHYYSRRSTSAFSVTASTHINKYVPTHMGICTTSQRVKEPIIDLTETTSTSEVSNLPNTNARNSVPDPGLINTHPTDIQGTPVSISKAGSIPEEIMIRPSRMSLNLPQSRHTRDTLSSTQIQHQFFTTLETRLDKMDRKLHKLAKAQNSILHNSVIAPQQQAPPAYTSELHSISNLLVKLYESISRIESHSPHASITLSHHFPNGPSNKPRDPPSDH